MISISSRRLNRGFTLVELAIVLGIMAVLAAGLWRLMAGSGSQMKDQAAAKQQQELIAAVRAYLASTQGQTFLRDTPIGGGTASLSLPTATTAGCPNAVWNDGTVPTKNATEFCNFLSNGFTQSTVNGYGQTYSIRVAYPAHAAAAAPTRYSFMILTQGGTTIPDTSGGRISSLIGGDGGFVYQANVCGANWACGAYGSWSVDPTETSANGGYGFPKPGVVVFGHVATRTYISPEAETSGVWLARPKLANDANQTFNTMTTTLFLGGQIMDGNTLATTTAAPTGVIKNMKEIYTNLLIYASDERLKDDIQQIKDPLASLDKLRAVSFTMKRDGRKALGLIAQDVEKVYPQLVIEGADGYKGVDYPGFVGPLVGAVKELKADNDNLRQKIEAQDAAIKKLTARLDGMKKK